MEKRARRRRTVETTSFCINDNTDVLTEVLKRLDGRSLGVAACVCRLWSSVARNEDVWEHLCFRHCAVSVPEVPVREVVASLGGYRRLYLVCVFPAMCSFMLRRDAELIRRVWTSHGAQLSISLFCVDYYERIGLGGSVIHGGASTTDSLIFLCNPVNV